MQFLLTAVPALLGISRQDNCTRCGTDQHKPQAIQSKRDEQHQPRFIQATLCVGPGILGASIILAYD